MPPAQFPEPALSAAEVRILAYLNGKWPSPATMTQQFAGAGGDRSNFVDTIQTLNDNGLISYEAFLIEASTGLRFIDTVITPRGKAALHAAEVHA